MKPNYQFCIVKGLVIEIFGIQPVCRLGGAARSYKDKSSNFSQYHSDGKSYRSDLNDDDDPAAMNRRNKYQGGEGGGGSGERDRNLQQNNLGHHEKAHKTSTAPQGWSSSGAAQSWFCSPPFVELETAIFFSLCWEFSAKLFSVYRLLCVEARIDLFIFYRPSFQLCS